MNDGIVVKCVSIKNKKQLNGIPTTVSSVAMATGGIEVGNFIERDIKQQ